ncbi:MAG: hypothetical protein AAF436_18140 [Myxococcota bacterium]
MTLSLASLLSLGCGATGEDTGAGGSPAGYVSPDPWTEEFLVKCDGTRETVPEPDDAFPAAGYEEYKFFEGEPGDVFVVRRCGVSRVYDSVAMPFEEGCETTLFKVRRVGMNITCYSFYQTDPGLYDEFSAEAIYVKYWANAPDPALPEGRCFRRRDCPSSDDVCGPAPDATLPATPGELGFCRPRPAPRSLFIDEVRILDITSADPLEYEEVTGTYNVENDAYHWWGERSLLSQATKLVSFPAVDADLNGPWSLQFEFSLRFEVLLDDGRAAVCDLQFDREDGLSLDNVDLLEGDSQAGVFLCDGERLRFEVTFRLLGTP